MKILKKKTKKKINTLGLICARGGSKRIKNKNIKDFCGKPLIQWTIELAKKCKYIDYLAVSTDSIKIAKIAKNCGAYVDFLRPKILSGDKVSEFMVWKHAVKFYNKKNILPKNLFIIPPTSPLRNIKDLEQSFKIFKRKNSDYHFAIKKINPFIIYKKNKDLKYFFNKKVFRVQDSLNVYNICTVAYLIKTKYLLNKNNFYTGKVSTYEVPGVRSIDIDSLQDFKIAEIIKKNLFNI